MGVPNDEMQKLCTSLIQMVNTIQMNSKSNSKDSEKETIQPKENISLASTEKVFIKESLKEAFNSGSGSGFSLLQLFGSKEKQDSQSDKYDVLDVKSKNAKTGKPFKYDSSDSESQCEQEIDIDNSKDQQQSISKQQIFSWRGTFFLGDDDLRLQEVFEFIKGAEKENSFGETRRGLKQIIRHKYRNNQRKKRMFKKKLGKLKIKK